MIDRALVWFRRDLRITDHAALYHALKNAQQVCGVFVFDEDIIAKLAADDRRLTFIWQSVQALRQQLMAAGGCLYVLYGSADQCIPKLANALDASAVYANEDYEPAAIKRDEHVAALLAAQQKKLYLFKDQVIFAKEEVLSQKGMPLTVFTPYKNAWLKQLNAFYFSAYPVEKYYHRLMRCKDITLPSVSELSDIGFVEQPLLQPVGELGAVQLWSDFAKRIDHYDQSRDFPAIKGVSYLSTHLRFGTVSIRQLVSEAYYRSSQGSATWLTELIWREFYMQFLFHHPEVEKQAYKAEWRAQPWENREDWFVAWCHGQTGYPIVDAAMRQLNQTGYMHNRLRMIVAAFLIKDLDINWQWGEAYFAKQLLDFDLAANNGGWQWAASAGCDAAQPFRIFNPILQSQKFDPQGRFIRKYVPELSQLSDQAIHTPWLVSTADRRAAGIVLGRDYPFPLVDHDYARKKALDKYQRIKNGEFAGQNALA